MAKKYEYNIFSLKDLERMKKDLQEYRDSIPDKCREIVRRLAIEGVEIAKMQILEMDAIFNGDLANSILYEDRGTTERGIEMVIIADDESAVFVEFGTGIVGESSPYPYDFPEGVSWKYNSGSTIDDYMINGELKHGWFYRDENGDWWFTEGMPSRPFMHNTKTILQGKAVEIVREVFASGK